MKTILITGSSRGIGKAVAVLAEKQGYRVIVHGRTDSEELTKTHKAIKGSVKTFFDIADKKATQEAVTKLGHIDVLINNAGSGHGGIQDVGDIEDEYVLDDYKVNVLGTLHCIQAVVPSMLDKGSGSIVNVSSLRGHAELAVMRTLPYAMAKGSIITLTKALAKAYPQIRINSVSPGFVNTDMTAKWDEERLEGARQSVLMNRLAEPEEVAKAIFFLASDDASFATGTDFLMDGGYAIKDK